MPSKSNSNSELSPTSHLLLLLFLFPSTSNQEIETTDLSTPVARFQSYLRLNTAHPNPNYTAPVSFLASISRSLNLTTRLLHFAPDRDKPVLLLTWPGSDPSLLSLLLNSHLDSVPAEPSKWAHPPFSAFRDPQGRIFARGAQDDKCISVQYLEAIRNLKARGFTPARTVHVSYIPDEEIGGAHGAARFVGSREFEELRVGFMMDEGQASVGEEYRVFYADRTPWKVIILARGDPGHGSRMYDNGAMENLMKSMEVISRFREGQFDLVKAGKAMTSEVISVNPVYLKAGIPSPTGFGMNVQPSVAEAGFDVRLPPTADLDLLKRRIAEEWAPAERNMTFEIFEQGPTKDFMGRPMMTATDDSNPWWGIFKEAIAAAGGKLSKPEILSSTTDARFVRKLGIPALGFSPMTNTPILLHDHNEFLKDETFLKGIKVYEHLISSLSSFDEVRSV